MPRRTTSLFINKAPCSPPAMEFKPGDGSPVITHARPRAGECECHPGMRPPIAVAK